MELPPRARRIPGVTIGHPLTSGTTSACAENTRLSIWVSRRCRNYLRVRGEYSGWSAGSALLRELPPRARRILRAWRLVTAALGTTSACAENTRLSIWVSRRCRNYLRVRGEYSWEFSTSVSKMELPPRARRILPHKNIVLINPGTTSACAENTAWVYASCGIIWNYLRVRGEYLRNA